MVDGTPHGSGNDRPSLAEQEIIIKQQEEEMEKEMDILFEQIEKAIES